MYLSALSNLFSSSRTSTFTSSRVCIIYQAVTIVDNPTALIDDQYNVFISNTFLSILVKLSALLSSDFQYLSDTSRKDNTRFLIHLKDTIIHTIIELYQVLPFLFLIIEQHLFSSSSVQFSRYLDFIHHYTYINDQCINTSTVLFEYFIELTKSLSHSTVIIHNWIPNQYVTHWIYEKNNIDLNNSISCSRSLTMETSSFQFSLDNCWIGPLR